MDNRQHSTPSPNMNSLRAATNSLEGCVSWIHKKQEQIQNAPLGTNFLSVQQALEQQRRSRREISDYRARLGKYSGSKYKQEDIDEMATGFNHLQDLTKDKGRCLDTLFHVSELEEYYQNLSAEIEKKALDLTEHEDHMCHGHMDADSSSAAKSSLACIYAVRNTWSWLNQVSRCLETHLTNSAAYHQFFHEVKHCDHGLKSVTSWLTSEAGKKQLESADAPKLTQEIRDITQRLLDFQVKVESLFDSSGDIIPLKGRRDKSKHPRKVRALIAYTHNDMQVTEGEECLLVDNSDPQRWKVRNTQGLEGYIPALALLVPPPDHEALQGSHRVRMQMIASWSDAVNVLRPEVAKFLNKYLKNNESAELKYITPAQRKEIVDALEDALTFLKPRTSEALCWDIKEFGTAGQSWRDGAEKIKDITIDRTGRCDRLPQEWKANQKLVRQLQELEEYVKAYTKHLDSTRGSHECVVGDQDDPLKFVSSAYIQRVKPEDKANGGNVDYEHIVMSERPPVSKDTDASKDNKCTSKETKTFVIVGIIDPRTGKQISIYEAITDGIISQTRGVYINPITGQSMPIPEAMSKGLILVEYTNSDTELDGAEKGVITTTTTMETVTYSVTGVIDPATRQRISVAEAIKKKKVPTATLR